MATGILQGLRAVLIYIISDAWYCESDSAQCKSNKKYVNLYVKFNQCVSLQALPNLRALVHYW